MANPQKENGHIDIANEIAEALARINLSPYQTRVLWVIWRKTWGWHKKEDRISIGQFQKLTGINKRNILRAIKQLIKKNLVIKKNTIPSTYGPQKDYEKWQGVVSIQTLGGSVYTDRGGVSIQTPKGVSIQTPTKEKKENVQIPPLPPKQVGGILTQEQQLFEKARKEYPGTKRGLKTEFDNFKKKHKDWKQVIALLSPAIEKQILLKTRLKEQNKFVPEWKHFQTWINQRCWEEEAEMPRSEWDDIPEITD